MFPLADVRGRVLGFGARAMREEQRPKYLNTSDNDIYHKGLHLYGADLARAHATRAGEVIVCEGYTDTIALHQAGMRNAVGLMGTALTGEQVGELARMAQTVLLALDADSAGQEAMLRAFRLATKRKLELRVVVLPAGTDPAELIQRDGAEAMAGGGRGLGLVRALPRRARAGERRPRRARRSGPHDRGAAPGVRRAAAERDADGADADRRQPPGAAGEPRREAAGGQPARSVRSAQDGQGRREPGVSKATARRRGPASLE